MSATNEMQERPLAERYAPTNWQELHHYANTIAKSDIIPFEYRGKPSNIIIAVQLGYEIGLKPLQSLSSIAVINGKPSIYGDAMLALVQKRNDYAGLEEHIENEGDNMVAYCIIKRKIKATGEIIDTKRTFSIKEAKQANLISKGPWITYPKRMLQMRARGFALRDAFADVLAGLISSEEASDYPAEKMKDVTPPPQQLSKNPLDDIVEEKVEDAEVETSTMTPEQLEEFNMQAEDFEKNAQY